MTHAEKIRRWIPAGAIGTEIGPGTAPLEGFSPAPIYVDCFKSFGAEPCRADFYGHARALPFHDNSLDYVAASHVLEHVANPVAALAEWYRVLRPGGIIYVVVPDRRATWEHRRTLTPVAHLLDDYRQQRNSCDDTHIDEFVFEADWSIFSPDTPPEAVPGKQAELARTLHGAVADGNEINIHFHTFEPATLRELVETLRDWPHRRFHWELVDHAEFFPSDTPNGALAVIRVHKGWRARADAELFRIRAAGDRRAVLREDAQPFAEWARRGGVSDVK